MDLPPAPPGAADETAGLARRPDTDRRQTAGGVEPHPARTAHRHPDERRAGPGPVERLTAPHTGTAPPGVEPPDALAARLDLAQVHTLRAARDHAVPTAVDVPGHDLRRTVDHLRAHGTSGTSRPLRGTRRETRRRQNGTERDTVRATGLVHLVPTRHHGRPMPKTRQFLGQGRHFGVPLPRAFRGSSPHRVGGPPTPAAYQASRGWPRLPEPFAHPSDHRRACRLHPCGAALLIRNRRHHPGLSESRTLRTAGRPRAAPPRSK